MERQGHTSKNLIDRRPSPASAGTHGFALLLGLIFGAMGRPAPEPAKPDADLVAVISTALDRGQAFWAGRLPWYRPARVVIFTSSTATPCGEASESSGPFYCPADEWIYIDPAFLRGIDGDLARAYVIAHELGHHVQNLTTKLQPGVALELQADCYAGAWMAAEQRAGRLAKGDIEAAIELARAAGDTGSRDTWTHGDSAARADAVTRGLSQGACSL